MPLLLATASASAQQGVPARPPSGMGGQLPAAAAPGQAAPPRCDANCVRANAARASEACASKIEAQAPSDFDWLTRPNPGIFQQADPSSPADSVVRFRGDSIRFMSPDHSWQRVSYECAYDVGTQAVVAVKVHTGRLDQAVPRTPAVAALGPAPVRTPVPQPAASTALSPAQVQAIQALAQAKKPRPHVGEPSPVAIQQEPWNPKL